MKMTLEQAFAEAQAQMTPHLMCGIPTALWLRVMGALNPLHMKRRAHALFLTKEQRADRAQDDGVCESDVGVDSYDYSKVHDLRVRLQELQEVVADCTGGAVQLPLASVVVDALTEQIDALGELRRERAERKPEPYRHRPSKYRLTYKSVLVRIPSNLVQEIRECNAENDILPPRWEPMALRYLDGSYGISMYAGSAMRLMRWFPRRQRSEVRAVHVACELSCRAGAPRLP
jgi:hypothetical protein